MTAIQRFVALNNHPLIHSFEETLSGTALTYDQADGRLCASITPFLEIFFLSLSSRSLSFYLFSFGMTFRPYFSISLYLSLSASTILSFYLSPNLALSFNLPTHPFSFHFTLSLPHSLLYFSLSFPTHFSIFLFLSFTCVRVRPNPIRQHKMLRRSFLPPLLLSDERKEKKADKTKSG